MYVHVLYIFVYTTNIAVFGYTVSSNRASLVAQREKHLPAMRETWIRSLGQEDPLEKGMATHSSASLSEMCGCLVRHVVARRIIMSLDGLG